MSFPSPTFAKLTRPTLNLIQARPRVFDLLEQRRLYPIVWVVAPPGYGKTSLAASYLEHSSPRTQIWYQLDSDDADAATFFYYLTLAAHPHLQPQQADLPLFTVEMAADLPRFARAFFRRFYALLAQPAVVVFDNVHELSADGLAALAHGLGEIPPGVTVIALSRELPPPALARLEINRQIGFIDIDALCFTDEEALALTDEHHPALPQLRKILPQIAGWPAGIALTLEHFSRQGNDASASFHEGREAISNYFAGEVFHHAAPEVQQVLLACAMLPSVSVSDATALSGNEAAGRVLRYLYRRRLFIDRRGEEEPTYHFHALFRTFLLAEVERRFCPETQRDLAARSARLLASVGRYEEAAPMFRQAGDWQALTALVAAQADAMLSQGRTQQWLTWLNWLPRAQRDGDTWLLYWEGIAQLHGTPDIAKEKLKHAFRAFSASGDTRGRMLTAAALILFQRHEWAQFHPLPQWVDALQGDLTGLDNAASRLSCEERLRVDSALLIGMLFQEPDAPLIQHCALQMQYHIAAVKDINDKLAAGAILLQYLNLNEGGLHASPLIRLLDPLIDEPHVSPFNRICWRGRVAYYQYLQGDYAASIATAGAARAEADTYGLTYLMLSLDLVTVASQLGAYQFDAARATLDGVRMLSSQAQGTDVVYFHYFDATIQLRSGAVPQALQTAAHALQLAREAAMPAIKLPYFMSLLASCHLVAGAYDEAEYWFDEAHRAATARNAERQGVLCLLARAYRLLLTQRQREAIPLLESALAGYRRLEWVPLLISLPDVCRTVYAAALENDIESAHVRRMIEIQRLAPPHYYLPYWPWPIRLRLLGGLSLNIAGKEVVFKGKMQKRPLELLKALVAGGCGEVDAASLSDRLWPDTDGAAARSALGITLHRLRKLLGSETAVSLSGGRIGMDRNALWTDVWALASLAEHADTLAADTPDWHVDAMTAHLLDLYRGAFCSGESAAWAIATREQARDRFVRIVIKLGALWERRTDWGRASALYTRALEADSLAEPFYRGLIRCALARNDAGSALTAYRRCSGILYRTLGAAPSRETELLMKPLFPSDAMTQ